MHDKGKLKLIAICVLIVALLAIMSQCRRTETDPDATVVKSIEVDGAAAETDHILTINTADLMSDGSVVINNYGKMAEKIGTTYTLFEDCTDVYCVTYGESGYRTILAITTDGTISALGGDKWVEYNRFQIKENIGKLKDVESIEQEQDGDTARVYAVLSDGTRTDITEDLSF